MLKWSSSYKIENQLDISFKDDVNQKISNGGKNRPKFKTEKHECLMETFCTCNKDAQPAIMETISPFVRRRTFTIAKTNKKSVRIPSHKVPLLNQNQQCDEDATLDAQDQRQSGSNSSGSTADETKISNASIPRTGFDFLDNW